MLPDAHVLQPLGPRKATRTEGGTAGQRAADVLKNKGAQSFSSVDKLMNWSIFVTAAQSVYLREDDAVILVPFLQAVEEVEKAVKQFSETGKVPGFVLNASMFQESYYRSLFIPTLLTPR